MALGAVENKTSRNEIEMVRKSAQELTCVENKAENRAMVGYFTFLCTGNLRGTQLRVDRATSLAATAEIELRVKLRAASQEGPSVFEEATPFSIAYFHRWLHPETRRTTIIHRRRG